MSFDSLSQALSNLEGRSLPHWQNYLGFYSSWLNGYFREPQAMWVPMDDHGFHRGDGVFEAVRIHRRAFIDLTAHLKRLERSAAAIGIGLPKSLVEMRSICLELGRRCAADSGILRLFVTRGPGGFSPSPSECVSSQMYAAITRLRPPEPRQYEQGVRAMISSVPAKDAFWSQIKSCNYLQNVLMKKECVEKGFDFAISQNGGGRLSEGSTENMMLISADGHLQVPRFDYTLRGTTVSEVMKMAERELVKDGTLKSVGLADVTVQDLLAAREAAFVGTTLGVLPLTSLDSQPIGDGRVGPICLRLQQMWMKRMDSDPELRSEF